MRPAQPATTAYEKASAKPPIETSSWTRQVHEDTEPRDAGDLVRQARRRLWRNGDRDVFVREERAVTRNGAEHVGAGFAECCVRGPLAVGWRHRDLVRRRPHRVAVRAGVLPR